MVKNLKEAKLGMIKNIIIYKWLLSLKDHNTTKSRLQLKNQDTIRLEKQINIINGQQHTQAKEVMVKLLMEDNIIEILKKKKMPLVVVVTLILELTQLVLSNGIKEDSQQIIIALNLHLETKKTLIVYKNQKKSIKDYLKTAQKVLNRKMIGTVEIIEVRVKEI